MSAHDTPEVGSGEMVGERCPECRHVPHASIGFCPNMASDNDCACTYATPASPDPVQPADAGEGLSEAEREAFYAALRDYDDDYHPGPLYAAVERILADHEAAWAEKYAAVVGERDRLQRWKDEALPVIFGLQELGKALGLRLGTSITGPDAVEAARNLLARAESAEAALATALREKAEDL